MVMDFPGKNKMLRYISAAYEKEESGLLVLYGEAGLGKTSLLQELMKRYDQAFYYQAVPASERQQAAFLCREMFPEAEMPSFPTFEDVLRKYAFEAKQKQLLMIDEFDHMMRSGESFMEEITKLVTGAYTEQHFLIVLCSSNLGFVANSMGRKMGRAAFMIKGLLKMKEYSYYDIRSLCGAEDIELTFCRYALMGGRPAAIQTSLCYDSLKDIICEMYLDRNGMFYDYGIRYIGENLREPNVYATILYMIANGYAKLNDLYRYTGFSRAKISVYLKNLIELDFVEKVYSYGAEARDDSRKGIYRITNPMIRFWYRFIYEHRNKLEFMEKEAFYKVYIQDQLDEYLEYSYAKVAAQLLSEGMLQELPKAVKCEEWVGKSGDIPVIALPEQEKQSESAIREQEKPFIIFTKRAQAVTQEDLDWYRFCVRKAGISYDHMIVFTEKGVDMASEGVFSAQNTDAPESIQIVSLFENILEQ